MTDARQPAVASAAREGGVRPWHFFLVAATTLAVATVFLLRGNDAEIVLLAALTVLASGLAAGAAYRMLHPLVAADGDDEALMVAGRTRASLERDKMLTLRAIKELEFDRAMGKIADADFEEMQALLRARALRLMRQLEGAALYRDQIEAEVARRVEAADPGAAPPAPACLECGTANEADARFCKMCGQSLTAGAERRS